MNQEYVDTVRLLLRAAPEIFSNEIFAMKGGTALNLFVQEMPRLSVDIDVVYIPWNTSRNEALAAIELELAAISTRLKSLGLETRTIAAKDMGDTKLLVFDEGSEVKVEVNAVFRGTVMPVQRRRLSLRAEQLFSTRIEIPTLDVAELYGSKLVAAMDRQHPRDLFDVMKLFATYGLNEEIVECFVTYIAGHNRPVHEVLFSSDKDISEEYESSFGGMTSEEVDLETLLQVRKRLKTELVAALTPAQQNFLVSLVEARPDWSLLKCPHAASLPGLRWKLQNLEKLRAQKRAAFDMQAAILKERLPAL